MILAPVIVERDRSKVTALDIRHERVTPVERIARYRHGGETVSLGERKALGWLLERKLFDRGCSVTILSRLRRNAGGAGTGWICWFCLFPSKASHWDLPRDEFATAADFRDRVARRGGDSAAE